MAQKKYPQLEKFKANQRSMKDMCEDFIDTIDSAAASSIVILGDVSFMKNTNTYNDVSDLLVDCPEGDIDQAEKVLNEHKGNIHIVQANINVTFFCKE